MTYATLETIHDLLKSTLASAEVEYKKVLNEYNETRRLVEVEGDDSPELLETLELDKDRCKSCRETFTRLSDAMEDFMGHDFN